MNEESLIRKLQSQIDEHIHEQRGDPVPSVYVCQPMIEPRGERAEKHVEQNHEEHGLLHVRRALEGVAAVDRKVPDHGEQKCDRIKDPMDGVVLGRFAENEFEDRRRAELNQPGGCGDQDVFDCA